MTDNVACKFGATKRKVNHRKARIQFHKRIFNVTLNVKSKHEKIKRKREKTKSQKYIKKKEKSEKIFYKNI